MDITATNMDHLVNKRAKTQIHVEETPPEFAHLFASIERQIGWGNANAVTADVLNGESCPYVLGVTSALEGEGKTTIAMHLALKAARDTYKRVCLIDLSLGDNDLCQRMGISSSGPGVIHMLEEADLSLAPPPMVFCETLTMMPAGKRPESASRTARSPWVGELVDTARQMFDIIIVDLPALSTNNLLPLATHVDGLIMVARAGATPRSEITRAVDQIGSERVLGLVMNRIRFSGPNWLLKKFQKR